jgi:hypothetical protein
MRERATKPEDLDVDAMMAFELLNDETETTLQASTPEPDDCHGLFSCCNTACNCAFYGP